MSTLTVHTGNLPAAQHLNITRAKETDMAERHEIEAWLGGNWPPEDTEQLIEQIMETDSDDEADWVRITMTHDGVDEADQQEVILRAAADDLERAAAEADA